MELNREADDEHLKTLEKAVKNKFRWHWLETTVEITLKGERKATSLIEWIRKIDVPGKAKCIVCDKIISYGARGRISLTEHCKSNEHAEKLKIKADNYTLGVPRPTENRMGFTHFSCSLIIFYTFDPICMRGTFMKYLVKVFIFTVQAEQS